MPRPNNNTHYHPRVQRFVNNDAPCLGGTEACVAFVDAESLVFLPCEQFKVVARRTYTSLEPLQLFALFNDVYAMSVSFRLPVRGMLLMHRDWGVFPGIHIKIRIDEPVRVRLLQAAADRAAAISVLCAAPPPPVAPEAPPHED